MKKVLIAALGLSLVLLTGCKSQIKGECSICEEDAKLYCVVSIYEGEEEESENLYCHDCAKDELKAMEALALLFGGDEEYKLKIKKAYE